MLAVGRGMGRVNVQVLHVVRCLDKAVRSHTYIGIGYSHMHTGFFEVSGVIWRCTGIARPRADHEMLIACWMID